MNSASDRLWVFILLQCLLIGTVVDSSPLSSAAPALSIMSTAGEQVVLPCSWKSRLGEVAMPVCHVQWATPVDTVFEQWGESKWQAPEFKDRVMVPEDKLGSGNCSLIISDVQIGDTGRYDSFMVVDRARSKRTRVFIQGVRLLVNDHKSSLSRQPGEDMVLNLHTRHSMRVVFQSRNSSDWTVLWVRDDPNSEFLEKDPLLEQLTVKKLKRSHEGLYKILDEQGLAVSTVKLFVEERSASPRVQHRLGQAAADVAASSSCSALLILSLLVFSFQLPHFL